MMQDCYCTYHQRRIKTIQKTEDPPEGITAWNECNTNADTCCLGKNSVVLQYTNQAADVYAYDNSIKTTTDVPIVTVATAWFDLKSNQTYILVINEALHYGLKLDHSLITPIRYTPMGTNSGISRLIWNKDHAYSWITP